MRLLNSKTLLGLLAILGTTAALSAQVLMLDFGPDGILTKYEASSPYHTASPGFTATNWNPVHTADIASGGLFYADGTVATNVSLDLGSNDSLAGTTLDLSGGVREHSLIGTMDNVGIYTYETADNTTFSAAARDGIFTSAGAGSVGLQVGGLAAGSYDIYVTARKNNTTNAYSHTVYAGSSASAGNFIFGAYDNATLTYPSGGSIYTASWVEGENYLKFNVTLGAGELLNLVVQGDDTSTTAGRGFLNSVQIVAIPEPSAIALIAGGLAIGLATLRRRRSC